MLVNFNALIERQIKATQFLYAVWKQQSFNMLSEYLGSNDYNKG
jgi:hypothetical protein